jgi:hypothetical protein
MAIPVPEKGLSPDSIAIFSVISISPKRKAAPCTEGIGRMYNFILPPRNIPSGRI